LIRVMWLIWGLIVHRIHHITRISHVICPTKRIRKHLSTTNLAGVTPVSLSREGGNVDVTDCSRILAERRSD